jgi:hypothetical protein
VKNYSSVEKNRGYIIKKIPPPPPLPQRVGEHRLMSSEGKYDKKYEINGENVNDQKEKERLRSKKKKIGMSV